MNQLVQEVLKCKKCKKDYDKFERQDTAPDLNLTKKEQARLLWCLQCNTDIYMKEFDQEVKSTNHKQRKKENMEKAIEGLAKANAHETAMHELEGRKLDTKPSLDLILSKKNNINPVEERLFHTNVEVKKITDDMYDTLTDKQIKEVREENVYKFYNQILHNFTIAAKGIFLVCRDLKKAKYALEEDDYTVLLTSLKISDSTASKYLKIANSDFCTRLYSQQRLPENWTTMYEVALVEGSEKLDQSVKDEVLKSVNHSTTKDDLMSLISKLTGKVKKAIMGMFTFKKLVSPRDFLKISVEDNDSVGHLDPNALLMIKDRVEKTVNSAIEEHQKITEGYVGKLQKGMSAEVVMSKNILEVTKKRIESFFNKEKMKDMKDSFISLFDKNLKKSDSSTN